MAPTDSIVAKGMALLECLLQIKRFTKKPIPKTIPGYKVEVKRAAA